VSLTLIWCSVDKKGRAQATQQNQTHTHTQREREKTTCSFFSLQKRGTQMSREYSQRMENIKKITTLSVQCVLLFLFGG
jgi:hypothetical protein